MNISKPVKVYLYTFVILELLISALYLHSFSLYINIQIGFISSFIVTISSFLSYRNFINSCTDEIQDDEDLEDKKLQKRLVGKSMRGFFSYYRFIGYMIFIFLFMIMLNTNHLSIINYIIGMSVSFVVPFVVFLSNRK